MSHEFDETNYGTFGLKFVNNTHLIVVNAQESLESYLYNIETKSKITLCNSCIGSGGVAIIQK